MVQIVASTIAAVVLALHLALTLQRPWLAPAGLLGAIFGAGYTAPPLRLKSRGVIQLAAYVGLLFIGPMILVAGVFSERPSLELFLASICFGAMQTGVLLVNTAEDLDEDEREGIRTVAVALGSHRTILLARALVLIGGLSFAIGLGAQLSWLWRLAMLPLIGVTLWNTGWLHELARRMAPLDEAGRREAIRKQGKHVPNRIETGAWMALLAAAAVFVARLS
jgi:1,4-dihydroxy-2-naphthoate octaprenyltransferase